MHIILIGPPGSGKGTQAHWLSQRYHIPHLSTGDMLRNILTQQSALSNPIKAHLEAGELVPDALVIRLIQDRIAHADCQNGFILDGFPRTLEQARQLNQSAIAIQHVIEFKISDATVLKRFSGRRIHPNSGRTYHIDYAPPKIKDQDDITGEPLIQRTDDQEATIQKRLNLYYQNTQPVLHYYQHLANSGEPSLQYHTIDAEQPIQTVRDYLTQQIQPHS